MALDTTCHHQHRRKNLGDLEHSSSEIVHVRTSTRERVRPYMKTLACRYNHDQNAIGVINLYAKNIYNFYLALWLCWTFVVMCGWMYVGGVLAIVCVFGNMCSCIYSVLYCLYCVFVLFRLCVFNLIFLPVLL